MAHPRRGQHVTLAAVLAPIRKQRSPAALGAPWPLPNLGPLEGRTVPAVLSQLLEATAAAGPGREQGFRSPEAGQQRTSQHRLSRRLVATAADLVRAGVSSMGPEDVALCWGCGRELSRWAAGGSPMPGHWGPHAVCHHVPGPDASSAPPWGGQDRVDGQILGQLQPLAEEEGVTAPPTRPAFPEMGSQDLRLASFHDWPLTAAVQPEPLAAAGFFHTGQQDRVRCFFCYGGLQSWKQGDDPWTEHAKWFPRCEFLLQAKGRDFVCSVQESCCHLLGSWDPWEEPEEAAPSTPSAPVHPGPELPTPRRDTQSERAREPGARDPEEQLQRLREERTCKVCLDRAVSIVFVPCGHLACAECAPNLQLCPICRAAIRSCVRTFLS